MGRKAVESPWTAGVGPGWWDSSADISQFRLVLRLSQHLPLLSSASCPGMGRGCPLTPL